MTEEMLVATRSLVTAVDHEVLFSKIVYLEVVCTLVDGVQKAQRKLEDTTRYLTTKKVKIGALELKVRLLTDTSVVVSELKKQLAARDAQIAVLEESFGDLNKIWASPTRSRGALLMEKDSARAATTRGERLIRKFADKVCTAYSSLVHAKSSSSRDHLNAVLDDVQMR